MELDITKIIVPGTAKTSRPTRSEWHGALASSESK
jgi:hypothetical protein